MRDTIKHYLHDLEIVLKNDHASLVTQVEQRTQGMCSSDLLGERLMKFVP
jgi:hypothetical protein